jgi:hypothetical protein
MTQGPYIPTENSLEKLTGDEISSKPPVGGSNRTEDTLEMRRATGTGLGSGLPVGDPPGISPTVHGGPERGETLGESGSPLSCGSSYATLLVHSYYQNHRALYEILVSLIFMFQCIAFRDCIFVTDEC